MPTPKFKPGQSGNPNGRPKGKTPGAQIRKAIEDRKDDILNAVIDAAVKGDMQACKMLLDRITPPLKPVVANVALSVGKGASLPEQGAAIVDAALSGNIAPDIASLLTSTLSNQVKIVEFGDLLKRIEALEMRQ